MSNEHNHNKNGIPVFIKKDLVGYLVCDCAPHKGYLPLYASNPSSYYVQSKLEPREYMVYTEPLYTVEFKFHRETYISDHPECRYVCWIAEIISGGNYIQLLHPNKFMTVAQYHGWIEHREYA